MRIGMWPIKTQCQNRTRIISNETLVVKLTFARSLLTGYLGFLQTRKALELTPEVFLRAPLIEEYLDFLRVRSFLIFFFFPSPSCGLLKNSRRLCAPTTSVLGLIGQQQQRTNVLAAILIH